MFEIKHGIMSVIKCFCVLPFFEFYPTEFPLGFLGNNGSKMHRSSLIQNKGKKGSIVDINCRALIRSFTENDVSPVYDRIIADGAERGFYFFGKCAVTDLCGCGWNTDDPTTFSETSSLCSSPMLYLPTAASSPPRRSEPIGGWSGSSAIRSAAQRTPAVAKVF